MPFYGYQINAKANIKSVIDPYLFCDNIVIVKNLANVSIGLLAIAVNFEKIFFLKSLKKKIKIAKIVLSSFVQLQRKNKPVFRHVTRCRDPSPRIALNAVWRDPSRIA